MSENKKEEESSLAFILDLEEQFACLVECLGEETKNKLTKLLKEKNKQKHKAWEAWKKEREGEKVYNPEKMDKLSSNFKWLTPITVIICALLAAFLWETSIAASVALLFIAFLSIIALLLSLFAPIEIKKEEMPTTINKKTT